MVLMLAGVRLSRWLFSSAQHFFYFDDDVAGDVTARKGCELIFVVVVVVVVAKRAQQVHAASRRCRATEAKISERARAANHKHGHENGNSSAGQGKTTQRRAGQKCQKSAESEQGAGKTFQ